MRSSLRPWLSQLRPPRPPRSLSSAAKLDRRVALLTATSNSGAACLRSLLTREPGLVLRAASRSSERLDKVLGALVASGLDTSRVESVTGIDAAHPDSLRPLFEGADAAFIVTPLDYDRGFAEDATLSKNMIDAAVAGGVKQIVYVGSWTVSARQDIPGIANRFVAAEEYLLQSIDPSVAVTSLRAGWFCNNFLIQSEGIRNGRVSLPTGWAVAPIHVPDIGRTAAAILGDPQGAAKHMGKIYDLSGPKVLLGSDVAVILTEELGFEVRLEEFDPADMEGKLPQPLVELDRYLAATGDKGVPCTSDVKTLTGEHTTFREFVRENAAAFRGEI